VLDAKLALVTGAGQGIGRAIALEMARQGAAGVAVADRDPNTAAETAELVRAAGAEAVAIVCDVRDRDQVEAMVARAVEHLGGLDVLVNNAGVIETSLTSETAIDTLPEKCGTPCMR
jgi:NAD(P)-dependent dehydrogenase (short-subunit alcohol dehydrogenase family)